MAPKPSDAELAQRPDGERDKLFWETQKLRAEAENLRRPALLSLKTIVPLVTAAIAILGAGFQYQMNEVRAAQTALEVERLEDTRSDLQASIDAAQAEFDGIGAQLVQVRSQLQEAEQQLRLAATVTPSPAAGTALDAVQLDEIERDSAEARVAYTERLDALRSRILAPLSSLAQQVQSEP